MVRAALRATSTRAGACPCAQARAACGPATRTASTSSTLRAPPTTTTRPIGASAARAWRCAISIRSPAGVDCWRGRLDHYYTTPTLG
jgi:hypothetical protein